MNATARGRGSQMRTLTLAGGGYLGLYTPPCWPNWRSASASRSAAASTSSPALRSPAATAARELGTNSRSLRRVRDRVGVGVQLGHVWAFTSEDLERLRPHVHHERGNPKWIALRANQVSKGGPKKKAGSRKAKPGQ